MLTAPLQRQSEQLPEGQRTYRCCWLIRDLVHWEELAVVPVQVKLNVFCHVSKVGQVLDTALEAAVKIRKLQAKAHSCRAGCMSGSCSTVG
jgi:hypothetical protein